MDRSPLEVDICPAERKQLRSAHSRHCCQNRHGAIALWQREQQLAHFFGFGRDLGQDVPLGRQSDTQGRVVVHVSPLPRHAEDLAECGSDVPEDTRRIVLRHLVDEDLDVRAAKVREAPLPEVRDQVPAENAGVEVTR